jgi:hypothetical protein
MKRLTLTTLALLATLTAVNFADAQVIGTYRPSVVTYYPTSPSFTPAPSQPQIVQASYYGAQTTPIATVSNTQAIGGCECTPLRSYPTNIAPTVYSSPAPVAYSQPVAYAAPVSVPVQTVAYNTQPALPPNRYIGTNLFGSPKVYANGQPVRNALRWLGP